MKLSEKRKESRKKKFFLNRRTGTSQRLENDCMNKYAVFFTPQTGSILYGSNIDGEMSPTTILTIIGSTFYQCRGS